MKMPALTAKEAGRLGDEIYERDIRPQLEETHRGKFVAIDVDSGDYAIADTTLAALEQLWRQRPDAEAWMVRVGYRTLRNFGGRPLRGS